VADLVRQARLSIALALSPPPIMLRAPARVALTTACATALVPPSNGGISKTPIGPFQTIVLASTIFAVNSSTAIAPISTA